MEMMEIFNRLGTRWAIKPAILKDIYLMMKHDIRFYTPRNGGGIRYIAMQDHLETNWRIYTIKERQLRYLVNKIEEIETS